MSGNHAPARPTGERTPVAGLVLGDIAALAFAVIGPTFAGVMGWLFFLRVLPVALIAAVSLLVEWLSLASMSAARMSVQRWRSRTHAALGACSWCTG